MRETGEIRQSDSAQSALNFPRGKFYPPILHPCHVGDFGFYESPRDRADIRRGGEIGYFFSAKYTFRFELEIYKVGFPYGLQL